MMTQARRLARWLRLVVTCLAFVIGSPPPAVAIDACDSIVMVASDDAPDEVAVDEATSAPLEAPPTFESTTDATTSCFASSRVVSRIYLANCALLL